MTVTPTDPLAEALAARKAAETVNGTPPPPHDPATGEIVPVPVEPPKPPAEVVTDWVSVIACDSPETPATEAAETKVA